MELLKLIQFKDIDFLNLLFNIIILTAIAGIHNQSNRLLKLFKKTFKPSTEFPRSQDQYSYQEVELGIYKVTPRPPAYMYLEDLPGVEWIKVDNSTLLLKTSELMCREICTILNSAVPISEYMSGLRDE